jgi:hypothetical protein
MVGAIHRTGGRRYRRRPRFSQDRRGVVAVVGTLLSMLVFFSLFGVFIEQYLPLWMTDNESQFTAETQASFAQLKSEMDLQAALQGPAQYATPFVMSSDGVPVLAQPTAGILNFVPNTPGVFANVTMNPGPGGSARFFQNFSLGTITMSLPDRYYSPQVFEYEDDAVIQTQSSTQQLMLYPPGLSLNATGSSYGVTLTLVQMLGNATQAVSTGTQEVYSHYLFSQVFTSAPSVGTVAGKMVLGTHYTCAWTRFLETEFAQANLGAHATVSPSSCAAGLNGQASNMVVTFTGLASFTLVLAEFSMNVGVGVE